MMKRKNRLIQRLKWGWFMGIIALALLLTPNSPFSTLSSQLTTSLQAEPLAEAKFSEKDQADSQLTTLNSQLSTFSPNHRISDAAKRSYWAHTFSSGAHSIAVHGRNVYATWYDIRNGDSDVFFTKSGDGGMTFGKNIRVNDDRGGAKQYKPSLGLDASGVIYLLWRDDREGHADIYFARSLDGGKRFSKNRRLNDDTGWAYQGNPAIGVSPEGRVYAAWSDNRNEQDDIYFTASSDGGKSFGRNIRLNDDEGRAVQSHPTIGAGSGGLVIVAWEDFRNGHSEIYFARSTDGGKSFGPNQRLESKKLEIGKLETESAASPAAGAQHPAPAPIRVSPTIAVGPQGRVALAWAEFRPRSIQLAPPDAAKGETLWWEKVREADADIFVTVSLDGGLHFGPPIRVNDDSAESPQAFPTLAVDGRGAVYAAWEDFRQGQADIYFAQIQAGVVSAIQNRKVNDDTAGALQYHPSIAVDENGRAYLLWTDGRGNPFVSSPEADPQEMEEEGNDVFFARAAGK